VQAGENLGRILVKKDFEKGWVGVGGTKVEVGKVDCAEVGIFGDSGVKQTVDERVGSDGSGDRVRDRQPIPTRCSPHPAINVGHDVPKVAGTKKSGGKPLLLHHVIKIRGKGSGGVNRRQCPSSLDELNQLVAVRSSPLVSVGTSESRTKGKGPAELVEVEDGSRPGGHCRELRRG
jgi:hypothetical protein